MTKDDNLKDISQKFALTILSFNGVSMRSVSTAPLNSVVNIVNRDRVSIGKEVSQFLQG